MLTNAHPQINIGKNKHLHIHVMNNNIFWWSIELWYFELLIIYFFPVYKDLCDCYHVI